MNAKQKTLTLRVFLGLLVYNFLALAAMQLTGYSRMLQSLQRFGYPDWTRFLLASLEISGVILLIAPMTRPYAVGALAVLVIGAVTSFLSVGFGWMAVGAIGLLALLFGVVFLERSAIAT